MRHLIFLALLAPAATAQAGDVTLTEFQSGTPALAKIQLDLVPLRFSTHAKSSTAKGLGASSNHWPMRFPPNS